MRKTAWQSALPSAVNRHEGATATPCLSPAFHNSLEIMRFSATAHHESNQ